MRTYPIAIAVFGIGMWAAQILPSVAVYVFGIGHAITGAQLNLLFEVSAFTATAAAAGFAAVRCRSILRALYAIPIAALLVFLIPSRLGVWLSESFRSVSVNAVVLGLLFAGAGAIAGWSVSRFLNRRTSHA